MTWLAVALGGACGALLRAGMSTWFPTKAGGFPWVTLAVNIIGCLLMGALYVLIVEKQLLPAAWRPWLMVGLLGAFTTFSTFSLEVFSLWQLDKPALASSYLVASVMGCMLSVCAGYFLTNKIIH